MPFSTLEQQAFQDSPDAVIIAVRGGRIVHANNNASKLTGFSLEELTSRSIDDLVPDRYRENHSSQRKSFHERPWDRPMGRLQHLELQMKDGTARPVSIELNTVTLADQKYVVASVRDDGPMRELRLQLKKSEATFRDLFDHAPVAYFLIGLDGVIHRCNEAAGRLFETTAELLVGTPVVDLYADSSEGKERAVAIMATVSTGESLQGEELELRTSRWARLYTRPVLDEDGEVVLSRGALVECTREKQLMIEQEITISRMREALRRVNNLEGLLGVCAWCKKVRDEDEKWLQLESYIAQHTEQHVTHSICPACRGQMDDDLHSST